MKITYKVIKLVGVAILGIATITDLVINQSHASFDLAMLTTGIVSVIAVSKKDAGEKNER